MIGVIEIMGSMRLAVQERKAPPYVAVLAKAMRQILRNPMVASRVEYGMGVPEDFFLEDIAHKDMGVRVRPWGLKNNGGYIFVGVSRAPKEDHVLQFNLIPDAIYMNTGRIPPAFCSTEKSSANLGRSLRLTQSGCCLRLTQLPNARHMEDLLRQSILWLMEIPERRGPQNVDHIPGAEVVDVFQNGVFLTGA